MGRSVQLSLLSDKAVRRPWAEACKAALRDLYPTSTPVREIAERLDRSKSAIWAKARVEGLRRPVKFSKPLPTVADHLACGIQSEIVFTAPNPEPPKPAKTYVRTALDGRQERWFGDVCERLERLWLANVDGGTIAEVLGPDFTAKAVWRKVKRLGLPARHGATLIRDVETARRINVEAAPLPPAIMHCGKRLVRRRCNVTRTWFWSVNTRTSEEAKESKLWQQRMSAADCSLAL